MKRFTNLYTTLVQTTKTNAMVAALVEYFATAPPADAAWAVYFVSGAKMRRLIPTKLLREWSADVAGVETWMFEECYDIVGDLAELMALILPPAKEQSDIPLHIWVTERLDPLRKMTEIEMHSAMESYWFQLNEQERFVLHKLITGSFRVGVSKKLVAKAIAQHSGIEPEVIAHRLMGNWQATESSYLSLLNPDTDDAEVSRPYPFYLAHPLESEPESLGDLNDWQAEWKWDGIRAQILKRENEVFIWSRGEDLMTERFPELVATAEKLPNGTALDGEIVACKDDAILPFSEMQRRIGRKYLGKKILSDVPVSFFAFDLIENEDKDIREQELASRREKLEIILQSLPKTKTNTFHISEIIKVKDWCELAETRQQSRAHQTEGLMLKRRSSPYRVGRPRGDWWKWKVEPYTVDAVLTYAQRGHGRRASLYTDYSFGVWDGDKLVTFAKAYSGLNDAEIRRVDHYVRRNTIERFGPVRSVIPRLVFELAFENIQESKRHKSGIAVRFPRIIRWREDLAIEDADSLETIKAMMNAQK